jgi:hypothetical protein
MGRAKKQHVQLEMLRGRGGKRRGAGRPPKGPRSSEPHKRRPEHKARFPVHITLRVVGGLGSLRRRHIWMAIREATIAIVERPDFRIVHASVQANHVPTQGPGVRGPVPRAAADESQAGASHAGVRVQ